MGIFQHLEKHEIVVKILVLFKGALNYKKIFSNTFYLSIMQFVNMLIPLVALPYIIKTIGASQWGLIAFVQSIVSYFFIIINYGLDVSAVKNVAQNRNDIYQLSEIVSAVLSIKFVLFLVSSILFSILVFCIPSFRVNWLLFYIVFTGAISEILFPAWYFQGVERMANITLVRFFAVLFYIVPLFFLVKDVDDVLFVPMLQVGGVIASSLIGFLLLIFKEKINLNLPSKNVLITVFKESTPFFLSRLSITINGNIATTISGLFLGMTDVAAFDLAKKIITFALVPIQMLNQAIYPHLANKQSLAFVSAFFKCLIFIVIVESLLIYLLAPFGISFLAGNSLPQAVTILRIFILFFVFDVFGLFLGTPVLIAFGYPKPFNFSIYVSTVALFICYLIFYLFHLFTVKNFTYALVLASIAVFVYRLYYCRKYELLKLKT